MVHGVTQSSNIEVYAQLFYFCRNVVHGRQQMQIAKVTKKREDGMGSTVGDQTSLTTI